MGLLGDAIGRQRRRASERSPFGEEADTDPGAAVTDTARAEQQPAGSGGESPGSDGRSELARRRDALAEQVSELHWDLGGLAYEMAIRDHFRLDVLLARAAVLQERDAELAEIDRLLALEGAAARRACPSCAAPHSRGALFCWQCGATLMERTPSVATPATLSARDAPTAPMEALLAGARGTDGPAHPIVPAEG